MLYMPILADNNFKSKKKVTPYTVTFAIPQEESIDNFQTVIDDDQSLLDNFEVSIYFCICSRLQSNYLVCNWNSLYIVRFGHIPTFLCPQQVVDEKTSLLKAEEPSLNSFPAGVQPSSRPASVGAFPTAEGVIPEHSPDGKPLRQGLSSEHIDKKGI